jgi:hypothetical protein
MVVLELFLLGLIFEVLTGGKGAPLLTWPVNLGVGIGIPVLLLFIHFRFKKNPIVKWLGSVPAAISAISFFALVVLLLGFIPQGDPDASRYLQLMGFTHMKNSWLMLVSGIYFLVTLGFVAIRRATPLKRKNLGFLLNHAGLWITIAAGYLGSGDLIRVNISTLEGHDPINTGIHMRTRQAHELPFSIELVDFNIEEYNPKLGIADTRTGKFAGEGGKSLIQIDEGSTFSLMSWDFEILGFLPDAHWKDSTYYENLSTGSAPAAMVSAVNNLTGEKRSGWVSCGSSRVVQQQLYLDQHNYLVMMRPEPEKFSSEIIISGEEREEVPVTLEVNKPFKFKGWKLYQLSYDDRLGKWSALSVVEAVRDPWLPVVYTGIFMLLAGAAYLFWKGREIKEV